MYVIVINHINWHRENLWFDTESTRNLSGYPGYGNCDLHNMLTKEMSNNRGTACQVLVSN